MLITTYDLRREGPLLSDSVPAITKSVNTGVSMLSTLNRVYRLGELPQFVGLRRTQISQLVKAGQFPKPISLSPSGRAVAWLESDLIAWQASRVAARTQEAAKSGPQHGGLVG